MEVAFSEVMCNDVIASGLFDTGAFLLLVRV